MKPIRVLYDEQIFLLQEHGGISRYFTELIKAFEQDNTLGVVPLISSKSVRNEYLLGETKISNLHKVKSKIGSVFVLITQLLFNRKNVFGADILHATFYLPGFLGRFLGVPRAVTLYDMIPENTDRPKGSRNPHFAKRKYMTQADLILSISNASTSDMQREYGLSLEIPTTYLGVGPEFMPNLPKLSWLPKRYLLFVGNRAGYKDCKLAFEAFADVAERNPDLYLQLVGGGALSPEETSLAKDLGIHGRIQQNSVSNEDLPAVYSNAAGLIYPSRYEGFGLPLVEAMASGVAVLASQTPINNEICGDSATFFPVGDRQKLAMEMSNLISGARDFQDKIASGLVRSKDFTWHKCAEKTAGEYRKLLNRKLEDQK